MEIARKGTDERRYLMFTSTKSSTNNTGNVLNLTTPARNGKAIGSWTKTKLTDGDVSETIDVTPAIATEMLTHNTGNRNLREGTTASYARDMAAGAWRFTGTPIAFDTNGRLADGQHRLSAVELSGATVRMRVQYNIEPAAQEVIDIGAARKHGDKLRIEGKSYPNDRAAWVRTIHELITGRVDRLAIVERNAVEKKWGNAIEWGVTVIPNVPALKRTPIMGAIVMAYPVDRDAVNQFILSYRDGENLRKGSPVFTLREYALMRLHEVKQNRRDIGLKTLRAIEVHIKGGKLGRLEPTESGLDFVCEKLRIKRGA